MNAKRIKAANKSPNNDRNIIPRDLNLFGKVLAVKREELGLSQSVIAQSLARSQSFVSDYENGKRVKVPALYDLTIWCSSLSLNPVELLYECGFLHADDIVSFARKVRKQASIRSIG